uniref:Protein-tyrosine phosphatase n=1 Tax=Mesocestoides corti TaxID=53468 RepID=A0A5K3FQD7_MESCO
SLEYSTDYANTKHIITSSSDLPAPVDLANFKTVTFSLDTNDGWNKLFEVLENASSKREKLLYLTQIAARFVPDLNRCNNTLPYDQSRVQLRQGSSGPLKELGSNGVVTQSGKLADSYINASYVRGPIYTKTGAAMAPSHDSAPEYIAAQAPLPHTVADFLTMIYEQKSPHIVMLCSTFENGECKCARYWPDQDTETFASKTHSVTVTKVKAQAMQMCTLREFSILPREGKDPWTVKQIQLTSSNDRGMLSIDGTYAILLTHLSLLAQLAAGTHGPPTVHCSTGGGRAGTFLCARYILDRLRKDPSKIDVFGTALALRINHKNFVKSPTELKFLYKFAEYCIAREAIQPNGKVEREDKKTGDEYDPAGTFTSSIPGNRVYENVPKEDVK